MSPKYKFEIHASTEIEINGDSAEDARMKLLECRESWEPMMMEDDCYISDGVEV